MFGDCRWYARRITGMDVSIQQALEHTLDLALSANLPRVPTIPGDEKIQDLVSTYQDQLYNQKQVKYPIHCTLFCHSSIHTSTLLGCLCVHVFVRSPFMAEHQEAAHQRCWAVSQFHFQQQMVINAQNPWNDAARACFFFFSSFFFK